MKAYSNAYYSLYIPLCLVYPPNVIAAACIFLAFRKLRLDPKEEILRANDYYKQLQKPSDAEINHVHQVMDSAEEDWCSILQTQWDAVERKRP